MTLTTTIDRVTYPGNGTATVFPFAFKIFAATNLVVELVEDATGTITVQVLNDDYIIPVAGIGIEAGGTVNFYTAPLTGYTVKITRSLPIVQEADFTNQGTFYPERHETALDYLTAVIQGVAADVTNALKLSDDGTVWDAETLRLSNVADGTETQDAVTLGQLEQVAQNLAAGQAAFAPLMWQYAATGAQFVFPLPGATITRADAYTVTWDGLVQSPNSYVIGVSSSPFVITFDSIPPIDATVLIRCIGVAETLSSANIDASGVVSGVFNAARLGAGSASDAVFLAGGPTQPTWTNVLNGPLTVSTLTFTGLDGVADTSLITTGVFPPARLGTGVFGVNTVLHGDGVFRIPAVATTTGFGVSDAAIPSDVYTSIVLTGESSYPVSDPIRYPRVSMYIKDDGGGSGDVTMEGYLDGLVAESFGNQPACSVLMNFGAADDTPTFQAASTNNTVLGRYGDNLQFVKVPPAALQSSAGTPDSTTFYRGDGRWSAPVASLGSSVATDPNGGTPTFPGTGLFFRGDNQWSNTITDAIYVLGSGASEPNLQVGTGLTTVVVDAQSTGGQIPVEWLPPLHAYNAAGVKLSGSDTADRVVINGRAWAVRQRGQGAPMVRLQNTATSGAITLNTNDYGHFITTPSGNVTYTVSDGGTDPTTDSYAAESILEVVSPGSNTISFTNVDWAGGITPTFAASGRNMVRLVKRMGITNWLGTLINSSAAGFTTEDAQDAVGAMVANSTTVSLTYSDATPSLTAAVVAGSIGPTQLASNAVETAKIAAGAVTAAKIAASTITVDKLAATGTRDATTVLSGANTWVPLSSGGGQAQIQFKDEGVNVGGFGTISAVNFTGTGVTASAAGSTLNVSVSGGGGTINYADDGFVVGDSATYPTLSFGTGLALSIVGGAMRVDATGGGGGGTGGQEPIQFRNEGTAVGGAGTVTSFNVVGGGANLSVAGTALTLSVPGGGSSTTFYSVKDYGAAGNGVADDTSEINAAISVASGAGGGIIFFPAGTYNISSTIDLSGKRVILLGVAPGASTIRWVGPIGGTMISIAGSSDHVGVQGLSLVGQASTRPARIISIGALQHSRFINLWMAEFTGYGVYAIPEAINRDMAWNHFESITIDARNNGLTPSATGIYMDGGNGSPTQRNCCHNTFVQLAISHNSGGYAMDFRDTDNNIVTMLFSFESGSAPGVHFGTNARSNYMYHCQSRITCDGTESKNIVFGYDRANGQIEPGVSGSAEILWFEGGSNSIPGMYFKGPAGTSYVRFDGGLGDVTFSAPNSGGVKRANSI